MITRVRDAARVLLGLSNSSQTAYRHPVRISPQAFLCDLCGEPAVVTGPGNRATMRHQCEDGDMFADYPGATRYVGVREHGKRVWAAFTRDLPRRVTGRPTEPREDPRVTSLRGQLPPHLKHMARYAVSSWDLISESFKEGWRSEMAKDDEQVVLMTGPKFDWKNLSEGIDKREAL